MEWNNGTIFRVYVNAGTKPDVDVKVDIAQQELNGKCFIGVENFVIKPLVEYATDPAVQNVLQDYWAKTSYFQLESYQLAPYIDFNSENSKTADQNTNESRNTQIFARLPLIASPTLGNSLLTTEATFACDRVLNKDSILYEMINNPYALSNGRLRFRILDQDGIPIPTQASPIGPTTTDVDFIKSFSFTLVVYKCGEQYN